MAIPDRLRSLYRSPIPESHLRQAPFSWRLGSWQWRFDSSLGKGSGIDYVEALRCIGGEPAPDARASRRQIDRQAVTGLASPGKLRSGDGSVDRQGVVTAFLASMIWGYGMVGYGPYRTERVLFRGGDVSDDTAIDQLVAVAEVAQSPEGGGQKAFEHIADARRSNRSYLKYLGPAFGTKFIYFLTKASENESTPVMDSLVAGWIQRHAPEVEPLNITWWDSTSYARYVGLLQEWAAELPRADAGGQLDIDDVELLIFQDARGDAPPAPESEDVTVESMLDELGAEADARAGTDQEGPRLVETLREWFAQNPSPEDGITESAS